MIDKIQDILDHTFHETEPREMHHHTLFMKAWAIQDVLKSEIGSAENMVATMDYVCEELNREAHESYLFGEKVTFIGSDKSISTPVITEDFVSGEIMIEIENESGDSDDEDDCNERDDNFTNTDKSVKSSFGPFEGFGYKLVPSTESLPISHEPRHIEHLSPRLLYRQLSRTIDSAHLAGVLYTTAFIDEVDIEFEANRREDALQKSVEIFDKFLEQPIIADMIRGLDRALSGADLEDTISYKNIAEVTQKLLNNPQVRGNQQFIDAVIDYVKYKTNFNDIKSIHTEKTYKIDKTAFRKRTFKNSFQEVETLVGDIVALNPRTNNSRARLELIAPFVIEEGTIGYVSLGDILNYRYDV